MGSHTDGQVVGRLYAFAIFMAVAVVSLMAFTYAWVYSQDLLYSGIDGVYNLWLSVAYKAWGEPFATTAPNPLQGMVSMQVAINPFFHPANWVISSKPTNMALVFGYIIYAVQVWISGYLLAISLGFTRVFSFVASFWLVLLLFPPFNYIFGVPGWISGAAMLANTIFWSNLALAAFARIGIVRNVQQSSTKALYLNFLFALATAFSLIALLLAAPFYNAGILPGFIVAGTTIVLSSQSWRTFAWRTAMGLAILALFILLNVHFFFIDAQAYSLRFSERFTQNDWYSAIGQPNFLVGLQNFFCSLKIACDSWAVPVVLNGTYWLQAMAIAGGFICAFRSRKNEFCVGLHFAWIWIGLMIFWLLQSVNLITRSILGPNFFLVPLYPYLAFFSFYAMYAVFDFVRLKLNFAWPKPMSCNILVGCTLTGISILLASYCSHSSGSLQLQSWDARSTPIVDVLRETIAIKPGKQFQGSVATIFGVPNGTLRPIIGLGSTDPIRDTGTGLQFLRISRENTGNEHDANDLWWFNVPTLFEYGQGVSPQLMFYMQHFLSASGDFQEIHRALPRQANIDVLRAMGVRFVISDAKLDDDRLMVSKTLRFDAKDTLSSTTPYNITLRLYELPNPNLGNFSPTTLRVIESTKEFSKALTLNPDILQSVAFVNAGDAVESHLVPALSSQLVFEKGGFHIIAKSRGRSALLLPVQFSHCYQPIGNIPGLVKIVRGNLIHTLIIFDRRLDAHFRWNLSLIPYDGCRRTDVTELHALGIL